MSNEQHGADAVEPDHNSTDDQTTIEDADATAATSGIIETAGAHAHAAHSELCARATAAPDRNNPIRRQGTS